MNSITGRQINLYIYEEQSLFRGIYKSVLGEDPVLNIQEINARYSPENLQSVLAANRPDILLMGVNHLDKEMMRQWWQIVSAYPETGIVVLLISCDTDDMELLRQMTARAEGRIAIFLKKSLDQIERLNKIILSVSQGQVVIDPAFSRLLFMETRESRILAQFTRREQEILELMANGLTNAAIADELFIDVRTVLHHVNSIYSKLKTDSRYHQKQLRVSAARLYLEEKGKLLTEALAV